MTRDHYQRLSSGRGGVGSVSAVASPRYQPDADLVNVDDMCPHLGCDLQGRIPQFSSQSVQNESMAPDVSREIEELHAAIDAATKSQDDIFKLI